MNNTQVYPIPDATDDRLGGIEDSALSGPLHSDRMSENPVCSGTGGSRIILAWTSFLWCSEHTVRRL